MPTKYGFETEQEQKEREEREKKEREREAELRQEKLDEKERQLKQVSGLIDDILRDYLASIGKSNSRIYFSKDDKRIRYLWVIYDAFDAMGKNFLVTLESAYTDSPFYIMIEYGKSPFWDNPPVYPPNIMQFANILHRVLSAEITWALSVAISWPREGDVAKYETSK